MHASSKHLVNKREENLQESINGFVYSNNRNLFTLNDFPNVVVRKDYLSLIKNKKVALLSGGGSGHEPAHTGYVGQGMLTAVVCGNLFASPSVASISTAIKQIGTNNEAGVLMIVKNYTGDRLNFGIAAKRAQLEGIRVEYVLVNDDVALLKDESFGEENSVGQRGLAGTVFIHKLAGALAEQNKSLDEIKQSIDSILTSNSIRTVGVSLSGAIDLPNESIVVKNVDENSLEFDEIEIGMGIHGEAGKKRTKLGKCYDLVESIFPSLELKDKDATLDICLMVNNLGSLSNFELNVLVHDCCKYLLTKKPNLRIRRLYAGTFMTALNMNGFSLTLFIVKDQSFLDLLDFKTNAASWPTSFGVDVNLNDTRVRSASLRVASAKVAQLDDSRYFSFQNSESKINLFRTCLRYICMDLIDLKDYLNELDTTCGDGDCGNSLEMVSVKILSNISDEKLFNFNYPHQVLVNASSLIEQCGGTLSAILALGTSAAAQAFLKSTSNTKDEKDAQFWLKLWHNALQLCIKAIQEFGRAKPGSRSMLDPLFDVEKVLKSAIEVFDENAIFNANEVVKQMVDISYQSAHSTAKMIPKVGRASYVDASLINKPDAGAFAMSSLFSSIYKAFLKS